MILLAVVGTCAACYGLKALGFVIPDSLLKVPLVERGIAVLPVALLSSLVVSETVVAGNRLVLDARAAGLAAAALVLVLRAPLALALVVAVATTALLRLAGLP